LSLLVLLGAPLIGSAASALVWVSSVGGIFKLALQPDMFRQPGPVLASAALFSSILLAETLSGILHWRGSVTIGEIAENLVFLGLLPLYVLFERDRGLLLADLRRGAPYFAVLAFAIALAQQLAGMRPEGGAGNPGVFAIVSSLVFVFCSERVVSSDAVSQRRHLAIGLGGLAFSAAAVLMSGSRALWPCLVLVPILQLASAGRLSGKAIIGGAAALAILVGVSALGPPKQRILDGINDLRLMQSGDYSTSLGKRLIMWKVGLDAVREAPWLGQGPDAPRRLMRERSVAVSGILLRYSHFHNFVLNEWVRSGVPGVAAVFALFLAPLYAIWRNRERDEVSLVAFQLVASCQLVFLATGMFNILFDHDIVDAMFVATHAFGLYLSFGARPVPAESASR
jgi:O-antigen ligase